MEPSKAERLIDRLLEFQAQTTAAEERRHPQVHQLDADRGVARDELLEYIEKLELAVRAFSANNTRAGDWARPVERPILMNAFSVRAILNKRKTQTRRVIEPQPEYGDDGVLRYFGKHPFASGHRFDRDGGFPDWALRDCPYGKPGDRLWVRETWRVHPNSYCCYQRGYVEIQYRQDPDRTRYRKQRPDAEELTTKYADGNWRPSIFMFRWASRLTLEVTDVRVERVQEITYQDILAEGIEKQFDWTSLEVRRAWIELWDSINAGRGFSWESNPWVWIVEFKVVKP